MKRTLIALFTTLALTACSHVKESTPIQSPRSTDSTQTVSDVAAKKAPQAPSLRPTDVRQGEGWKVLVPEGMVDQDTSDDQAHNLKLFTMNEDERLLIALNMEQLDPKNATNLEAFVLETRLKLSVLHFEVSNIQPTTFGGLNGVSMVLSRGRLRVFQWLTVNNGTGVILGCGGLELDAERNAGVCKSVADTFQFTAPKHPKYLP